VGPSWCCLCQQSKETNSHIFMFFQFTNQVWKEVEGIFGLKNVWVGNALRKAFRIWCTNRETRIFRALPLMLLGEYG
jgi:hypothetical protein